MRSSRNFGSTPALTRSSSLIDCASRKRLTPSAPMSSAVAPRCNWSFTVEASTCNVCKVRKPASDFSKSWSAALRCSLVMLGSPTMRRHCPILPSITAIQGVRRSSNPEPICRACRSISFFCSAARSRSLTSDSSSVRFVRNCPMSCSSEPSAALSVEPRLTSAIKRLSVTISQAISPTRSCLSLALPTLSKAGAAAAMRSAWRDKACELSAAGMRRCVIRSRTSAISLKE